MKRLAFMSFIFLAVSIIAGRYLKGNLIWLFAIAAILACIALYAKTKDFSAFILLLFVGVGIVIVNNFSHKGLVLPDTGYIKGTVYDINFNSSGGETVVIDKISLCTKSSEESLKGRGIVYTNSGVFVKRNDVIAIKYEDLKSYDNFYTNDIFDTQEYMLINKLSFIANAEEVFLLGNEKTNFRQILMAIRDKFGNVFDNIYPKNEAGILKAIILGDTSCLDSNIRELYSSAGIAHVLAVSGLHTAIIALTLKLIFKKFGINNRKTAAIIIAALSVYAIFVGAKPSVVRSVIMVNTAFLGEILYRKPDSLNSMGLAGIIILFINPYNIFNIGFQLSFISVLSIMLFAEFYGNEKKGFIENIKQSAMLSFFVSICTFPITAYGFYKFSLYGFITNLFVVPFLGLITVMAFLSAGVGFVSITAGKFLGGIVYCVLKYINAVCNVIVSMPFSVILCGKLSILFVVLFYCVIISIFAVKNLKIHVTAFILILCVFSLVSNKLIFKYNNIDFMTDKYGGGVVINTYDNKVCIIGQKSRRNTSKEYINIVDYINSFGKDYIDVFILSGTNTNDFRFAKKIINEISVNEIYIPKCGIKDYEMYSSFINDARKYDIIINYISANDKIYLNDNFSLNCVYPISPLSEEIGYGGLVLKMNCGNNSILYSSDISAVEMRYIIFAGYDIAADVLRLNYIENEYVANFIENSTAEYIITYEEHKNYLDLNKEGIINFKTNGNKIFKY